MKSDKSKENHQRNVQISANNWIHRENFRRKDEKMIRLFYLISIPKNLLKKLGIPLVYG